MKYIKLFEEKKFIDEDHRKTYNLSQRLERAINKYFNKTKGEIGYIYVETKYQKYAMNTKYPIILWIRDINYLDSDKYEIFASELKKLKVFDNWNYSSMTIEQAEKLLFNAKLGFITNDIEKYNL